MVKTILVFLESFPLITAEDLRFIYPLHMMQQQTDLRKADTLHCVEHKYTYSLRRNVHHRNGPVVSVRYIDNYDTLGCVAFRKPSRISITEDMGKLYHSHFQTSICIRSFRFYIDRSTIQIICKLQITQSESCIYRCLWCHEQLQNTSPGLLSIYIQFCWNEMRITAVGISVRSKPRIVDYLGYCRTGHSILFIHPMLIVQLYFAHTTWLMLSNSKTNPGLKLTTTVNYRI